MKENVILLQEINSLKKEYHELQLKLRASKNNEQTSKGRSTFHPDPNESEEI